MKWRPQVHFKVFSNQSTLHIYDRNLESDFYTVRGQFTDGAPLFFTY